MLADRQAIAKEIFSIADTVGSRDAKQLKQLRKKLGALNQRELFEGLFLVFLDQSDSTKQFERQQLAGRLLYMLRPPCPYDPKDAIRMTIDNFNVSVEELPWYLAVIFGKDKVTDAIGDLKALPLEENERTGLKSFEYWIAQYDGKTRKYY